MVWLSQMVDLVEQEYEAARVESVRCDDEESKAREKAVEAQHRFNLLRELFNATIKLQAAQSELEGTK